MGAGCTNFCPVVYKCRVTAWQAPGSLDSGDVRPLHHWVPADSQTRHNMDTHSPCHCRAAKCGIFPLTDLPHPRHKHQAIYLMRSIMPAASLTTQPVSPDRVACSQPSAAHRSQTATSDLHQSSQVSAQSPAPASGWAGLSSPTPCDPQHRPSCPLAHQLP